MKIYYNDGLLFHPENGEEQRALALILNAIETWKPEPVQEYREEFGDTAFSERSHPSKVANPASL